MIKLLMKGLMKMILMTMGILILIILKQGDERKNF